MSVTIVLIVLISFIIINLKKAETSLPKIRRLPALDAIDEVVGRAVEMGRPVHFTSGYPGSTLYGEYAMQTIAGLTILSNLAHSTAKIGARLLVSVGPPEQIIAATEIVRGSYIAEGKQENFREEDIIFQGNTQRSYMMGVLDTMRSEKIAGNIMVGSFMAESLMFLFNAADIGALQIGGTANTHQLPFFAASADYVLIGEDIFAAGAYLSGDRTMTGSLAGEDWGKYFTLILIIASVISAMIGATSFLDILSL
jgi:hypothetical protein